MQCIFFNNAIIFLYERCMCFPCDQRQKSHFLFIIATFTSTPALAAAATLAGALRADLDASTISSGVKLGFFKRELNGLFNRTSNSFEVIATGDGCKMSSPSEFYFFNLAKFEFNKHNLKTNPSSNLTHLNPTLIHPVFKSELEFTESNEKNIKFEIQ